MKPTLASQLTSLAEARTTSLALVEAALADIVTKPAAYTDIFSDEARSAARASDQRRATGQRPRPLEGVPIPVKDLFDIAGLPTRAGTRVLEHAAAAATDATVVTRLKAAGAIIIGRTHMSPFAFSGIGLNPDGPQPVSPCDPERVPGGSSSGAGVTVGLGQVAVAIGSDTGGSVRIPAACCGVVGFKPTKARVACAGAAPLSPALDSIGPIANTVEDCRLVDAVIADAPLDPSPTLAPGRLRLGVLADYVMDGVDDAVAADFSRAVSALSAAGAAIVEVRVPGLVRIPDIEARGGLINAQAHAVHRRQGWLDRADLYDPNVLARIQLGGQMSADDYLDALWGWSELAEQAGRAFKAFDAVLWPTCPIPPPRLADVATPDDFARANAALLRNTRIVNLMDMCAISLPMHEPGALPTGLMITARRLHDASLLAVAAAIEQVLGRGGPGPQR